MLGEWMKGWLSEMGMKLGKWLPILIDASFCDLDFDSGFVVWWGQTGGFTMVMAFRSQYG